MNATPATRSAAEIAAELRVPQDMEFLKEDGHVGDCVRACTATLLGLPRADVPHFVGDHESGWRGPWVDWLGERGLTVVEIDPRLRPMCEYLACGPTIRDGGDHPAAHMVVMDWLGVKHDPHPSRGGLTTTDRVYLIVPRLLDSYAALVRERDENNHLAVEAFVNVEQNYATLTARATAAESEAAALRQRVGELELAVQPFAEAAEHVPASEEDFKVIAHVPAGPHAAAFKRMSNLLTAGHFRIARAALQPAPATGERG